MSDIKDRLILALLGGALTVGAVAARPAAQAAAGPVLEDLRGVDELKTMFNRDAGKVRMILLLSPT